MMFPHIKIKNSAFQNLSSDILLNLLATFVSTGVMQLILYPQLALHMDDDSYGKMLTVMGLVNILALSFGNNLCNARIILNGKYKKDGVVGDFQLLVLLSVFISFVVLLVADVYFRWDIMIFVGIILASGLTILKSYYLVTYRITINYKKNLYANIVMALFYILGAFILIRYVSWPFVFALPCLACMLYIFQTSDILIEPLKKTNRFRNTTNVVTMLIISGLIGNVTMYLDRFIVYPILGGSSVSYYTIATFFSKSMSMVLLPMTSVLLTYVASDKIRVTCRKFVFINWGLVFLSILFLLISISIGYYVTALLYPTMIEYSKPYLLLASMGIVIGIAGSFNSIIVLAKAPSYWQVVLSGLKLFIYLISCIILVKLDGIEGLCLGVIITNLFGFIAYYIVGNYYLKRQIL